MVPAPPTGLAALGLLTALDPSGRHVDAQRLAPVTRAAGLAGLLADGVLVDDGSRARSTGARPAEGTRAMLWDACRGGVSWRSAVGSDTRRTIKVAQEELESAGLARFARTGIGPFGTTSASITAAGQAAREQLQHRLGALALEPGCDDPLGALVLGLREMGLVGKAGVPIPPVTTVTAQRLEWCWPGPAQGVRRAALDRRIVIV